MLTLNDGRSELWQWDTGRILSVDADCSQVHFSNKVFGRSIDVDVTDGVAIIPDVLLQTDKDLIAWAFVGTAENGFTKVSKTFKVNKRNKPADYVFTPVEQTTIDEIAAIAQSVRDDADAGLFDGKPGRDGRDGVDGKDGAPGRDGADGKDGIPATHSWNGTVLTVTSASGTSSADLKGDKGDKGEPGKDGTDANVTAESIKSALGYTPADSGDLANKLPKSPADWETWTEDEQATARDKIGIPGGYELIEEIILGEDVSSITRTEEPDGTPYNFSAFCVIAEIVVSDSETSNIVRIDASADFSGNLFLEYFNRDAIKNKRIHLNYEALSPKLFRLSSEINDKNAVLHTKGYVSVRDLAYSDKPITKTIVKRIRFLQINFMAGTKIKIYGVRA